MMAPVVGGGRAYDTVACSHDNDDANDYATVMMVIAMMTIMMMMLVSSFIFACVLAAQSLCVVHTRVKLSRVECS